MRVQSIHLPLNFKDQYWQDNFQDLRDYVRRALGWPVIRVELHPDMLNQAIYNAIANYVKIKDLALYYADLAPDQNGWAPFPLDTDGKEIVASLVRDVIFKTTGFQSNLEGYAYDEYLIWPGIYEPGLDGGITFDFVKYYMVKQNLEDFRKAVGIDRTWEFMNGGIQLYPARADHQSAKVIYGDFPSPAKIQEEDFVRSWAVAEAMLILARVRGKISGIALPGGNATWDAADMRQEAQEIITQLREGAQRPVIPIWHL
jgi:hypothetical protein